MTAIAQSPLTSREERIIEANSSDGLAEEPCPECGRTIEAVDMTDDGHLYVWHAEDSVDDIGMASRDNDEIGGCRIDSRNDPTL